MKKIVICISAALLSMQAVKAQDLLDELQKEDSSKVKQNFTTATFKSTRIINMNSVEMTGAGNMQFMIRHHFGQFWNKEGGIKSSLAQLFGLNSGVANAYMSFDYSPKSWLNIGLASTGNAHFEGWTKFRIIRQQTGKKNIPVTLDFLSNLRADASDGPSADDNAWNRFSYLNQVLVARKFSEKLSLQFIGSVVHHNLVPYGYNNSNNTFSAGLGGRYKLTSKSAITFEFLHSLNNYKNQIDEVGTVFDYKPLLIALGYDWDTGGHIFQFFISNTSNASNITQLSRNTNKVTDLALGFNLNRSYGIKKVVKVN